MPQPPAVPGPARSADAVNEEIRALVDEAAAARRPIDSGRYQRLVVEWAAARQAGQELAA